MASLSFIFLVVMLTSIFSLLVFIIWMGRQTSVDPTMTPLEPQGEEMKKYLYLKSFYVNPSDPRGWLPKINPALGWTVNFRSKANARAFLLLLIIVLFSSIGFAISIIG